VGGVFGASEGGDFEGEGVSGKGILFSGSAEIHCELGLF
jgi:hypothetical protein